MRPRKVILKAHLWLGLLAGVPLLLTSASGALLVFRHAIDRALNPGLYRATPGREVGLDAVVSVVVRAFPSRGVAMVDAPAMPRSGGVYVVRLAGEPSVAVHVDPGTGAVLGWRDADAALMERVFRLHTELLAGEAGSVVVGLGGLLLLAMIGTGLRLWWPGRRKLALGVVIRRGRGRFLLSYDTHKVVGLVAAPFLAVVATTGALLSFPGLADRLIFDATSTAPGPGPARDGHASPGGGSGRPALDESRRIAEAAVPGATIIYVQMPGEPGRPVQVRLRPPGSPHPNGRSAVGLDPRTGRVLWARDERRFSAAEAARSVWLYPLHIGTYAGVPSRAVHVLVGLAPIVLLATGLVIRGQHARSQRVAGRGREVRAVRGDQAAVSCDRKS